MHTRVHPVDIKRVILVLKDVIRHYLKMGYKVDLDEFGSFNLTATSEGVDCPYECRKKHIRNVKLVFRPGKGICPDKEEMEFKSRL